MAHTSNMFHRCLQLGELHMYTHSLDLQRPLWGLFCIYCLSGDFCTVYILKVIKFTL